MNFVVPADYKIELKENEKKDKYLDLVRELKKKKKQTVEHESVIGTFGIVTKWFLQGLEDFEIRGRVEIIQITALLKSARIVRRFLEIWGDLLSLKLQWETIC